MKRRQIALFFGIMLISFCGTILNANAREEQAISIELQMINQQEGSTEQNASTNATNGTGIDLVKFFTNVFYSPVFWIVFSFLIIIVADYNNHPIVKIESIDGKLVRLGRYITEVDEPKINKKKFIFLNKNGIQEIYSNFSFRALDPFNYQQVYIIEWDYPHLLMSKLQVPEKSGLKSREILHTFKNRAIWVFFTIFRFTPFRFISLKLYNLLAVKEKPVKEVDYLIPYICMDSVEYRFNATYEQLELNTDTKTMEYVKKTLTNVNYADILSVKRSDIQKLQITLHNVENIKYPTLKEAQEDKHSRFEIINSYENRTTALEVQILELEQRLQSTYTTIQKQKMEVDQRIRDGLKPMEESNEFLRSNFPDMLATALEFRNLGIQEKKAIEQAILTHIDKNDKERETLKAELAKLQTKLEDSKKPKKSFNPNEITITTGDEKNE